MDIGKIQNHMISRHERPQYRISVVYCDVLFAC